MMVIAAFLKSISLRTASLATGLALAACGGGSSGETPFPPVAPKLTVEAGSCGAALRDSGKLLYVVLDRACTAGDYEMNVRLQYGTNTPVALSLRMQQELQGIVIPGLGTRQVGLFKSGQWRSFANESSWVARDGAGLLVLKGNLYLLGGWANGPVTSEVWRTDDVANWTFLGNAPWPSRHAAAWLTHKNRLWVIGGDLYTDVWSSADGIQWDQMTADAGFGPRYTPNAAVVGDDIVLYAGQNWEPVEWCNSRPDCLARADRSVWKTSDGKTWSKVLDQAPWQGRGLVHGSAVFQDKIFLIGGGLKVAPPYERYQETIAEYTDIWSTPDGVRWTQRSANFSFPSRTHFSVLGTDWGCYVSDGSVGSQGNLSNDFFFAPDCINFSRIPVPLDLGKRHASSLVHFNGSLVLLGGPNYGTAGTAVWQYFP
jgi:hypothetical protein